MTWFDDDFFLDDVYEFLLFEIDDYFVPSNELIEESKYVIIISFCPWIIGTMSKDKTIS